MSILQAPYHNAMRLGQGFNSYTQQICIDDAVVINPERAENVVTNDGTTMRIMAQAAAKPSAWSRQKEVVSDDRAREALKELEKTTAERETDSEPHQSPGAVAPPSEQDKEEEDQNGDQDNGSPPVHDGESEDDVVEEDVPEEDDPEEDHGVISGDDTSPSTTDDKHDGDTKLSALSTKSPAKGASEHVSIRPRSKAAVQKKQRSGPAPNKGPSAEEKEEEKLRKQEEKERLAEQRKHRQEFEKEEREAERERKREEREEQKVIRDEKRKYEAVRREESRKAISDAAKANSEALSLADLEKIKAQNQYVERFSGMDKAQEKYDFDPTAPRGPSQTVIYSSRFVDKLSDVTSDMSISGALTIKAAKIGGSGRGSFVDSDKFKQSDLNFYISVKVVNQTVNFKDPLVFNHLKTLPLDSDEFRKAYGDSFISGFVEGGEFNALVSMKIHNKAKMTDIQAQAKVALTAGPVDITAEANVAIARSNIETNTETTIQVSWCGGGHIKPMEQPWNIETIMQAASRFPDLVAECPQRTYAILTKYGSLRSYIAQIPAKVNPLQYENAQIYTNVLMDTFVSYKSLYTRLTEQISGVQSKLLEIEKWPTSTPDEDDTSLTTLTASKPNSASDLSKFEASIKGLDDARKAIRRQMILLVNEVDLIERNPKIATDEDHQEPFQSSTTFESRLPDVQTPQALRRKNLPLSGERIQAKPQSEEELKKEQEDEERRQSAKPLDFGVEGLTPAESQTLADIAHNHPGIGDKLRVSTSLGNTSESGTSFNNLDFVQSDWDIDAITVTVNEGAVVSVEVAYENGLILRKPNKDISGVRVKTLNAFKSAERIVSATVEAGNLVGQKDMTRILSIVLLTNRGRSLRAQADTNEVIGDRKVRKDGFEYENVTRLHLDCPFVRGTFRGFFGRENNQSDKGGILRIGVVWGEATEKALKPDPSVALSNADYEGLLQSAASSGDAAELNQLRADKKRFDKEKSALHEDIEKLKRSSKEFQGRAEKAEERKAEQEGASTRLILAQGDSRIQPKSWAGGSPNPGDQIEISFTPGQNAFVSPPRVITGISHIAYPANSVMNASVSASNITTEKMTLNLRAGGDAICRRLYGSWMAIPANRQDTLRIETGVLDTVNLPKNMAYGPSSQNNEHWLQRTYIPGPPMKDLVVVSWFQSYKAGTGYASSVDAGHHSLATDARKLDNSSFDLNANTWWKRNFHDAQVGWLAFDKAICKNRVQVGDITVERKSEYLKNIRVEFQQPFDRPPVVFAALHHIDADASVTLATEILIFGVDAKGFSYNGGIWETPSLAGTFAYRWIAIS